MNEKNKLRNYWTKEKCHEVALLCSSRIEFNNKYSSAYVKCVKNKWLYDICNHMIIIKNKTGYWNKEKCHEVALKYTTRSDFKSKKSHIYRISCDNNWLDEICSHMIIVKQPNGYWTKERCHDKSLLCNSRREFSINYSTAYSISRKNNWLDDICIHMSEKQKPKGYWTKEKCLEISILCKDKIEFMNNHYDAYKASLKLNCLDEICSHMIIGRQPNDYWTKERCHEDALKYTTKSEWIKKSNVAYLKCNKNKWLNDVCSHMTTTINKSDRIIYSFEFEDKSIYIGLTCNIKTRYNQHLNKNTNSSVIEYINKTKITPIFNELTDFIPYEQAQEMEIIFIEYYRKLNYNILNKVKGGNLGGSNRKLNYDYCKKISLKYNTIYELSHNKRTIYNFSKKNNWLDDFYPNEKCNFDTCKIITSKFKNRSELKNKNHKIYRICKKNNWLDIFYKKKK